MASPTYTVINASEVDADSPLTAALAFRWTYNPISIMQGSPTARAAGMGVWVAKSPGGGDPAQTGILTDATDTSLRLAPDGAGSVAWSSTVFITGTMDNAGTLSSSENTTATAETSPDSGVVIGGKKIIQGQSGTRILVLSEVTIGPIYVDPQDIYAGTLRLYRKRGAAATLIKTEAISIPVPGGYSGQLQISIHHPFIDSLDEDGYFCTIETSGSVVSGSISIMNLN